jgi:hypothetical protein
LGIGGAKEILKILKRKLHTDLDIKLLEKELADIENELGARTIDIIKQRIKKKKGEDTDYIG